MPTLFRFTDGKVARPPEAVTAPPPVSVELPGFARIASETLVELSVVTRFAPESSTRTVSDCVWSAALFTGAAWKASWLGAPGVMLNETVVSDVRPGLVACSV